MYQTRENYCLCHDESYFVPGDGFKKMNPVNFLNHSDTPNLISINNEGYFEAINDNKQGQELVIDCGEIADEK